MVRHLLGNCFLSFYFQFFYRETFKRDSLTQMVFGIRQAYWETKFCLRLGGPPWWKLREDRPSGMGGLGLLEVGERGALEGEKCRAPHPVPSPPPPPYTHTKIPRVVGKADPSHFGLSCPEKVTGGLVLKFSTRAKATALTTVGVGVG